ncbi:SusC/RagA family TonB-linked outer membrane protein [Parapedobacter sp. SGR-10]|nr:SusC/RagA family TonB-linked outer membrane protein [Parapedobacter sp. SGR-10]
MLMANTTTETKTFWKQSREISGKITDTEGTPLGGVTITAKGTSVSTASNEQGEYSLSVPNTAKILVFSIIGYQTQELEIGTQHVIDISLSSEVDALEEVVVVGYGTMQKKDLTGSVTQIRPDNIAIENPKTVQDILRGTPGLRVGFETSAKGGGSLELRGQRSVYTAGNHNTPLLILDGMFFYGELSEINPDDIEQIDILKDASAAAVYGAKAANGVIIITTKKGQQGVPVINMTTNFGWSQLSTYRERFSPDDYLQHRQDWLTVNTHGVNPVTGAYEAYQVGTYKDSPGYFMRPDQLPETVSLDTWRNYTTNAADESDMSIWAKRLGFKGGNALENILNGKTINWKDHAFRTGFNQDYNASVSGAGEKANYYLSMGYLNNEGVVKSDQYQAVRANMKVNLHVNKWLEIGANVNFQNRSDGNVDLNVGSTLENSPYADYADEYGNPLQFPLDNNYDRRGYNYDFQKQYLELEKGYTVLNSIWNAKIKLPYNITYTFNASPRYQFFHDRYFMSAALPGSNPADRGVNREQAKRFDWSLNNILSWEQTFAQKHRVNVTLVQEAEERQFWSDRIEARRILPSDALGFHNTQNGSKEDSNFSSNDSRESADGLLARLFYSYNDRYMITTSFRRDGYSAFGTSNPYAFFPSAAVAWTFTNEDFFKWSNIMNFGKLRVSYGENGNRSLDNPYLALSNLSSGAGRFHGYINDQGELELLRYLMAERMANPGLQWEKTSSWNIGLDFGFLNNRLSGSIEYYRMQTHDMIMQQRLPEFTGFPHITTNLGQVNNNGVEISINTLNIDRQNFKWATTLGFFYNKNEIKHLYYDYKDGKEMDDETNGWFIGQPISSIWNYRVTGIWQKEEVEEAAKYGQRPGDPKVANLYTADDRENIDGTTTPVYNNNDKVILGQTAPPFNWSIRNEFTLWNDLTVLVNIYSYMGHKSVSGYYLNNDDDGGRMSFGMANSPSKNYWTIDNPTNEYGRIQAKGPTGAETAPKLYDRSFIRLENISVGYTLPKSWTSRLDIGRVKAFASVRNVAHWSKQWEYGDPETWHANDNPSAWAPRLYTLGLNLVL